MTAEPSKSTESMSNSSPDSIERPSRSSKRSWNWKKWAVLVVLLASFAWVYSQFSGTLDPAQLAAREQELRNYQNSYPILVLSVAFTIYVVATGLSIPGATILTLAYGWYFGFLRALVLVSFASSIGATLSFLLCRYLLRDVVLSRFGSRLESFNRALKREGAFYLFSLRLIPAVPFFVINAVMGLTPIKTRTFYWVSQVGMLPGTIVYVFAGSRLPNLQALTEEGATRILTPDLILAFVLLGLFPFGVRFFFSRFSRSTPRVRPDERR